MADGEGFIYVNRSGKGKKRKPKTLTPFPELLQLTRDELVSSGWWALYRAEIIPTIGGARQSILGNGQLDAGLGGLGCLCLGLGRPTKSVESRAQLGVLLDLCDELAIARAEVELFDPAFEVDDISVLRDLGLSVLDENKRGAYVIDTPTLVYMPHCGVELYERFLRANWSAEAMGRIILVANNLAAYVESTPARILEAQTPCVARIASRLRSTQFPSSSALPGAFNNTALQVLCGDKGGYTWSLAGLAEWSGTDGEGGEVR